MECGLGGSRQDASRCCGEHVSGTLLVAGYVNVDLLARVDRLPASGDRVTARSITRAPGGMAANVACAASRLGACVRFFGVVGRDEDGNAAVEDFQRFRVNTEGIVRVIKATTRALILVEPSGNRAIVSEPTSMDYTSLAEALSSRLQPEGDSLYVDGYHVLSALPPLRRARSSGG